MVFAQLIHCVRNACRHAGVSRAASALLQQWRALDPALAVQPLKSALAKSSTVNPNLQSRASLDPPQVTLKLKAHLCAANQIFHCAPRPIL